MADVRAFLCCLAALVVLFGHCSAQADITCSSPRDPCIGVRQGAPEEITCNCSSTASSIVWRVGTRQLVNRDEFAGNGITVLESSGQSSITLNSTGRDFVVAQLPVGEVLFTLTCLIGSNDFDLQPGDEGDSVRIAVYNTPPPPEDLSLTPTSTALEALVSWKRPMSLQSCVPLSYTINIVNLNTSMTEVRNASIAGTSTGGEYTFTEMDSPCQLHEFQVRSVNDAGTSDPATINETIPISPDIAPISNSLTARPQLNGGFNISISFQRATSCSPMRYPVLHYIITLLGLAGNLTVPSSSSAPSGQLSLSVGTPSFPGLGEGNYTVIIQACTSFTCRAAQGVSVVTSDVQSANITFFNTTVSLYCVFADSGSAMGCRFLFTLTNGTQEEIDILRPTAGGTVSMDCAQTNNRREAYTSIQAFDLEADGTRGSLNIQPSVRETNNTEDILPCTPPTPTVVISEDNKLSSGEIAAIIIPVLVVFAIIVAIVIAIIYWKGSEIKDRVLGEDDGIDLMVKEENNMPTVTMLVKNVHKFSTLKRKKQLTREISQQPDLAVSPANEHPPGSRDGPIANIRLTDSSDSDHVQVVFNPIRLAHYIRVWKTKATSSGKSDELPLFCNIEDEVPPETSQN